MLLAGAFVTVAYAQTIVRGYGTKDTDMATGMAVSLTDQSDDANPTIERLTENNKLRFAGVITEPTDTVAALPSTTSNIPVVAEGSITVFTNTAKGTIKKGDTLTASSIAGTLSKTGPDSSLIIGTASEDFNESKAQTKQVTINGSSKDIKVGLQKVEISPKLYASVSQNKPFIVRVGEGVTGRPISTLQAVAALAVFLMVIIVEAAWVYAGIKNSFIAIGRNPLSKQAVYRQLLQVAFFALAIFVFGAFVIYGILLV